MSYTTTKIDMRYTCPKCGYDIGDFWTIFNNLDSSFIGCPNCGWRNTKNSNPYIEPFSSVPNACKNCSNHPSNGGSGICHCILGQPTVT